MSEFVNIMIKEDIITADGYVYKSKNVYENVLKYEDLRGRTCYEPEKGHIISQTKDDDGIIELGFISSEVFRRLKEIIDIGDIDIKELAALLEKIQAMESSVNNLEAENEDLKKQINILEKKCDSLAKMGNF